MAGVRDCHVQESGDTWLSTEDRRKVVPKRKKTGSSKRQKLFKPTSLALLEFSRTSMPITAVKQTSIRTFFGAQQEDDSAAKSSSPKSHRYCKQQAISPSLKRGHEGVSAGNPPKRTCSASIYRDLSSSSNGEPSRKISNRLCNDRNSLLNADKKLNVSCGTRFSDEQICNKKGRSHSTTEKHIRIHLKEHSPRKNTSKSFSVCKQKFGCSDFDGSEKENVRPYDKLQRKSMENEQKGSRNRNITTPEEQNSTDGQTSDSVLSLSLPEEGEENSDILLGCSLNLISKRLKINDSDFPSLSLGLTEFYDEDSNPSQLSSVLYNVSKRNNISAPDEKNTDTPLTEPNKSENKSSHNLASQSKFSIGNSVDKFETSTSWKHTSKHDNTSCAPASGKQQINSNDYVLEVTETVLALSQATTTAVIDTDSDKLFSLSLDNGDDATATHFLSGKTKNNNCNEHSEAFTNFTLSLPDSDGFL